MKIQTIDDKLRTCLSAIFSKYPIVLAYLYGSEAVGQATPLSDFDIALVMDHDAYDSKSRLTIELELEEEIARNCGIGKVDVRITNEAPLMVQGEVLTKGILLYSRDEAYRVDYETSTRSAYFDFLPIAVEHREAYFERLIERGKDG